MNTAIEGEPNESEVEAISHFWRRSAEIRGINAENRDAPRILTESTLRLSKEPIELLVRAARPAFADQSHLSRSFRALVGLTPSEFRRAHRRQSVRAGRTITSTPSLKTGNLT